jgi:hypothetical protein
MAVQQIQDQKKQIQDQQFWINNARWKNEQGKRMQIQRIKHFKRHLENNRGLF